MAKIKKIIKDLVFIVGYILVCVVFPLYLLLGERNIITDFITTAFGFLIGIPLLIIAFILFITFISWVLSMIFKDKLRKYTFWEIFLFSALVIIPIIIIITLPIGWLFLYGFLGYIFSVFFIYPWIQSKKK